MDAVPLVHMLLSFIVIANHNRHLLLPVCSAERLQMFRLMSRETTTHTLDRNCIRASHPLVNNFYLLPCARFVSACNADALCQTQLHFDNTFG